jgi:signal transduction histidine kinase
MLTQFFNLLNALSLQIIMRNYFRIIQWIATLTACSILVFQAVWVYRTYRTSEVNFRITAREALQRSVDQYLLEQIPTPVTLSGSVPSLSIINSVSEDNPGKAPQNLNVPFNTASDVRINFQPLQIDTANLESVQLFVAKMIVLSNKQKIDLPLVSSYFRKELEREGIDVAFNLSLLKSPSNTYNKDIAVSLGRGKGDWIIYAIPASEGRHLLTQNMVPALVSLFLILLTAGCLWYMGLIIVRQRRLDQKKNEFIDNLAHELRTPVSILKSTNEALLHFGQVSDAEKTGRYLQFNADVLDKLESDLDRLLRIRKYDPGTKNAVVSLVNLPNLVQEVTGIYQLNAENHISFSYEPEQETVTTDAGMLKDILANLVDNALKYSKEPAIISIRARSANDGWQLVVEDNGIGISEENLLLIFDKFYRVDTGDLHEVKGYGIGLSYVKELTKQLGGEIKVNSKEGVGTTFIITFPI